MRVTSTSSTCTSTSCTTAQQQQQPNHPVTLQLVIGAGLYTDCFVAVCNGLADCLPDLPQGVLPYVIQQEATLTFRLPGSPVTLLFLQRGQVLHRVSYHSITSGPANASSTTFVATQPDGTQTGVITAWLYTDVAGSGDRVVGPPIVITGQQQVSFPVVVQVDPMDQARAFTYRMHAKSSKPTKFYGLLGSYDRAGKEITCYRSHRRPGSDVTIVKIDRVRKRIQVSPASALEKYNATDDISHRRSLGFYTNGDSNKLPDLNHLILGQNCVNDPNDMRPPANQQPSISNSCNPLNGAYHMLDIKGGWIFLTDLAWQTFESNIIAHITEGVSKVANHYSAGSYCYPIYRGSLGSQGILLQNEAPFHVQSVESWIETGYTTQIRPESCWIQPGMLVNWYSEDVTVDTEVHSIEVIANTQQ